MKKLTGGLLLCLTLASLSSLSLAKDKAALNISNHDQHNTMMQQCIATALQRHPGAVIEVELENEDGKSIFDVDVLGKDGKVWEVECDAASGEVLEDKEEKEDVDDKK
ncbi:MAG: hypothetical protein B7Y16_00735 [Methylotenera sp. 24-45-7]|jgi:uncharacterized membrane protein YkoI|nr:MAG: hypothetical protein B7Y72_03275 [Mehylophilales bacterium 35-46-6]OYZ41774.1 MAG: hypothetical protein B7Y16_00735 [Methylotenera sp. 24-45-7]OZA53243.1 MAG: hypothetical protein B7X73_05155 [Methylophilales bacterium 39-45-7]HQS38142.1 PepSY domain-containing protein [Methylotenera sp.]HQS44791.1 PepSY domain-containing protein [Methylotenera sp.]